MQENAANVLTSGYYSRELKHSLKVVYSKGSGMLLRGAEGLCCPE